MHAYWKRILHDKDFYRTLVMLALPIIIQNFIVSSLNMVDTLMIGAVGENEVAAVGIANQFFFLFNLVITGASAGCSIFISQFWGAGNKENIQKVMGAGLIGIVGISVLFTVIAMLFPRQIIGLFSRDEVVIQLGVDYLLIVCLSYLSTGITFLMANALRSISKATAPMLVSLIAILINTVFNYLLIFGKFGFPQLGVKGAALATLLARVVEMVCILIIGFQKSSPLRGRVKSFLSFDRPFVRKLYGAMVPVILNEGCWGMGFVLYSVAYGQLGTQAIAATQITNTVQNLFMVICFSMSSAALVMIGHQIGAGKKEVASQYGRNFTWLSLAIGLVMGVLVAIMAPTIMSFFKVSQEAKLAGVAILRIFSFMSAIRCSNCVQIVGVFRGGGDAKYALKIEVITMWMVGVPLAFFGACVLKLPVEYVVALISLEEIAKLLFDGFRLKSDKWIHDLTLHHEG